MNEKLQDLLDTVQRTAGQVGGMAASAAYGVGKKAEELLDAAKLRIRIATLEGEVEERLAEIGGMIYATHTGNPTDSDALLEKLQELDGVKEQIAELQARLGIVQQGTVCPLCGAAAKEGDQFCRECGGTL